MAEHKTLGLKVDFAPITQAMLEAWQREMRALNLPALFTDEEFYGAALRCAFKCHWVRVPALAPQAVDEMPPAHVSWLGRQVVALRKEVTTVPPE